jgi:hypothetical protein
VRSWLEWVLSLPDDEIEAASRSPFKRPVLVAPKLLDRPDAKTPVHSFGGFALNPGTDLNSEGRLPQTVRLCCGVCLERFAPGVFPTTLACLHCFHPSCLHTVVSFSLSVCPSCKTPIVAENPPKPSAP